MNILSITDSMASTVGTVNPIRYRSYYYDRETGFYLAGVRYYDPIVGRWISPEPNVDSGIFEEGTGLFAYNVYAYCANNPVNFYDPTGEFILACIIVRAILGAVAGGVYGHYGYASLSKFIQSEIARDVWLRANNAAVKVIEWHFYKSQATGKGGPSDPLLKALLEAGIKVVFH